MGNRRLIHILLCLLLIFCLILSESCKRKAKVTGEIEEKTEIIVPDFNCDSAYTYVAKQVDFGPRVPGTQSHKLCGDWLVSMLDKYADTVYVQPFKARIYTGEVKEGRNIFAQFNPDIQKRILLCAHWDSRPYADYDPDPKNHNLPIPGANDGASGVGVLLELARIIHKQNISIDIDIAFWDLEDWGEPQNVNNYGGEYWCLGSQYWCKNKVPMFYNANYGILLDMVGATDATFYFESISYQYASSILKKTWDIASKLGYSKYFIPDYSNPITDDHLYLNTIAQIPTINIVHQDKTSPTGFFPYWHTMEDDIDKIDKNTLKVVGNVLTYLIYNEK